MLKFEQTHVLEFETVSRGHHIYKSVWTPVFGEKLHCHHDTRDEAKSHDDYAIGIYKPVDTAMKEKEALVGHLPIELSFLLCKFLESENCGLLFSPTGPRLQEDGLVVPGKYIAKRPKKRLEVLKHELDRRAIKLNYMKLDIGVIMQKIFLRTCNQWVAFFD